jgi:hypothetical protein
MSFVNKHASDAERTTGGDSDFVIQCMTGLSGCVEDHDASLDINRLHAVLCERNRRLVGKARRGDQCRGNNDKNINCPSAGPLRWLRARPAALKLHCHRVRHPLNIHPLHARMFESTLMQMSKVTRRTIEVEADDRIAPPVRPVRAALVGPKIATRPVERRGHVHRESPVTTTAAFSR